MNKQGWTTVLVHAGCYNEITQTRWLVNNGNMSPFWRPEVCDQGGACLWGACLDASRLQMQCHCVLRELTFSIRLSTNDHGRLFRVCRRGPARRAPNSPTQLARARGHDIFLLFLPRHGRSQTSLQIESFIWFPTALLILENALQKSPE